MTNQDLRLIALKAVAAAGEWVERGELIVAVARSVGYQTPLTDEQHGSIYRAIMEHVDNGRFFCIDKPHAAFLRITEAGRTALERAAKEATP